MIRNLGFFACALACCSSGRAAVTLDELLRKTIDSNPQIQIAKIELERAAGQRLIYHSVGLPDAVIGAVAGDQGGHRAGEKPNQPFALGYGGVTQALFNAAVPASNRRGDIEVLIAQQKLNLAVTDQLHAARVAFYTAQYSRSLKQLRTEQRQRLEQNIAGQRDRYQSGVGNRATLVGAELQTRELDPMVEASQRGYDGAIIKLAEAMGQDLGPSALLPEPAGELKYAPLSVDLSSEIPKTVRERSDLQLARLLVRAAREDQRIMEAAYYPVLNADLAGEYIPVSGVRKTQSEGGPRRSDDVISSEIREGAAYTWRVIDNGKVYGAVLQARSAREINELLLHRLEQDVARDMTRIQQESAAISTKYDALSKASAAAEGNAATVGENLTTGVVSGLEFRLAQNAFLQVKSELLTLAYQDSVARAEWDRATGRYLQFSDAHGQNVR